MWSPSTVSFYLIRTRRCKINDMASTFEKCLSKDLSKIIPKPEDRKFVFLFENQGFEKLSCFVNKLKFYVCTSWLVNWNRQFGYDSKLILVVRS